MESKNYSVLIVAPSFMGGGAERVAVNLANQYASEGIRVTILVVRPEGPYREQLAANVRVVELNCKGRVSSLLAVFKALKRLKPDNVLSVIRGTNILVGFSRFFVGMSRVVFREANTLDHIYKSPFFLRWLWYFLLRASYSNADLVVANSEGTSQHLFESKIVKKRKVRVIDNPVLPPNVDELLSDRADEPWLHDPDLKVVLNVGRLHKQKNQALLIKAFSKVEKEISNARLIILGEGVEAGGLLKLAIKEGVAEKVKIIPFQKNPYPYYNCSDVFVLSSDYEGFGNVVVEALSSGKPIISTSCPGGPRGILADGKYGLLVETGNIEKLSLAILDVLKGKVYFESSALKGRSQEYSIAEVSKRYWSLFEEGSCE